jgi:hypothetical protein
MSDWHNLGKKVGGVQTQARLVDENAETFEIRHSQDVAPILERNKALALENDGYSKSREFKRVASIPNIVIEQWKSEGIDLYNPDHAAAVMRKLNSSDYRFLRTAEGTLGMSNGKFR